MPIYWTSRAVIHVLVLMVETTAFTTRKAVYYTVGTRVSPVYYLGRTTMSLRSSLVPTLVHKRAVECMQTAQPDCFASVATNITKQSIGLSCGVMARTLTQAVASTNAFKLMTSQALASLTKPKPS